MLGLFSYFQHFVRSRSVEQLESVVPLFTDVWL